MRVLERFLTQNLAFLMMGAICDACNFQDDFPENFFGGKSVKLNATALNGPQKRNKENVKTSFLGKRDEENAKVFRVDNYPRASFSGMDLGIFCVDSVFGQQKGKKWRSRRNKRYGETGFVPSSSFTIFTFGQLSDFDLGIWENTLPLLFFLFSADSLRLENDSLLL